LNNLNAVNRQLIRVVLSADKKFNNYRPIAGHTLRKLPFKCVVIRKTQPFASSHNILEYMN